jgi:crotonobetainyl-CoA:carnitine CoA-transferase CaiB-like acyl-CoA transferase
VPHIAAALETFFASIPLEEAWHGGQELGLPWGAIRSMDEIIEDQHLQDRSFFTEVSHPELGRSLIYPGPAALYSKSAWRISRRAPLIGEHNVEVFCGELGLSKAELVVLAESAVV